MPFVKIVLSAVIGIPSVLAIFGAIFGALWGLPLIVSQAFGIPVQSWGWALFGIPLVAIMCILMFLTGGLGISLVNQINK